MSDNGWRWDSSCVQPTASTVQAPGTGNVTRYLFVSGALDGGAARPAISIILPTNTRYFGLLWGGGGLTGLSGAPNANDRITFNYLGGGSSSISAADLVSLNGNSYVNFFSDTQISSINFSTSGSFSFRSDNHRFNTSNVTFVPEPAPMLPVACLMLGGLLAARRWLPVVQQAQ